MKEGYILLNRSIQDHWLWEDEPFDKARAWIDLIMLANWKDKKTSYKGEIIICKRGDVNLSILKLSERWKWSRWKTTEFLKLLEKDNMFKVNATTNRTTITIVNYEVYQVSLTTDSATDCTTNQQRANTTNKDNKDKNKEKIYKKEKSLKFNDIIHTEYDIDDIEKKILGGN